MTFDLDIQHSGILCCNLVKFDRSSSGVTAMVSDLKLVLLVVHAHYSWQLFYCYWPPILN